MFAYMSTNIHAIIHSICSFLLSQLTEEAHTAAPAEEAKPRRSSFSLDFKKPLFEKAEKAHHSPPPAPPAEEVEVMERNEALISSLEEVIQELNTRMQNIQQETETKIEKLQAEIKDKEKSLEDKVELEKALATQKEDSEKLRLELQTVSDELG